MARSILARAIASASRYDLVLAAIPSAFALGLLLSTLLPLSTHAAIAGASLVGALAVVDALFLNPPSGPERARSGA